MRSWGLSFAPECLVDMGRQISGPTLQFNTFTMKTASADFSREATTNKCYAPVREIPDQALHRTKLIVCILLNRFR